MKKYILPTLTVMVFALGILIGSVLQSSATDGSLALNAGQWSMPSSKVDQLLQLMESTYVDSLDVDSITDEVMSELVQKLDPHSSYIPKEDLEMVSAELSGSFSGIGVQFTIQQDTIRIVAVIAGGPCEGVGVLAGDKIITVDDSLFVGKKINNEKVMRTLRGEKGTKVKLGILRPGTAETLYYTVTRGDIPVTSVDAKFIIEKGDKKIGFIRVNKFGETTYKEFISALAELREKGASAYIIDLRENSGGYMDQAIRMANEFLSHNDLIVYAEGRAYPRYEAKANGQGRFKETPITVLIDDFSASASEIFAGAMQDNDRAQVIGRRSFGKGLVQQQMPFSDGSAVRLTVARYYTPSGRCIQKPYSLGEQEDYQKELLDRFEHGEFFSADSIHFADTTSYYTKSGRIVRGGGGIMPDIFVSSDTVDMTSYAQAAFSRGLISRFALGYGDRNRRTLSRFKTHEEMTAHLDAHPVLDEFIKYAEKKGLAPDRRQIARSKEILQRSLYSNIIYQMQGMLEHVKYINLEDPTVLKAVEILEKGESFP